MIGAGEDPPPPSFSKGARDENSVLFSVKDLASAAALRKTAAAPVAASPAYTNPMATEGMVDLRAIANTTQSSLEVKPLDIAALRPSVVPMQAQHPSSMWPTQEDPNARKASATPKGPLFYAAIAAAALVFVGFGAGLTAWAMSGDGADMAQSAIAPAPDEGVIEREVVQRTKVAEAPETAATPTRHSGGRGHGGHASVASSKGSKPSKTSTAPKKGSDPCNCHGVLACAMRCTK